MTERYIAAAIASRIHKYGPLDRFDLKVSDRLFAKLIPDAKIGVRYIYPIHRVDSLNRVTRVYLKPVTPPGGPNG